MADQGIWWKLWCSALDDPHLDNLEIGDFGRYCKLGAFVKRHGVGGSITILPPARALCSMLQVADFTALVTLCERLPNVEMRGANCATVCNGISETNTTVSFLNWKRYQADHSTVRVRRFRAQRNGDVTPVEEKRRDEMRKEKKRGRGAADSDFIATLKTSPAYTGIDIDRELGKMDSWLLAHPRRQKTRQFIVRWLNKIEIPMEVHVNHHPGIDLR